MFVILDDSQLYVDIQVSTYCIALYMVLDNLFQRGQGPCLAIDTALRTHSCSTVDNQQFKVGAILLCNIQLPFYGVSE